jgi:hypothetical protein
MEALDGNALAGALMAQFGREMTSVVGNCRACGTAGAVAELRIFVSGPGTVARCPSCGAVAGVLARDRFRLVCLAIHQN